VTNVEQLPEPEPKPGKPKKKSAAAQRAEADDGFVTVEHCGVNLRIGVGDKMPAAVVDTYIDGDMSPDTNWKALRAWVGEEQWDQLKAAGMTRGDVMELDRKLGEISGN
jgi:phosphosulfolactate phosphohydrolase-like enzyme